VIDKIVRDTCFIVRCKRKREITDNWSRVNTVYRCNENERERTIKRSLISIYNIFFLLLLLLLFLRLSHSYLEMMNIIEQY